MEYILLNLSCNCSANRSLYDIGKESLPNYLILPRSTSSNTIQQSLLENIMTMTKLKNKLAYLI